MKVLNDFQCNACGTLYVDKLVENTELTIDCLNCPNSATKVRTVPNFSLPGNDPAGFPTAADKWVKKREQKIAQENTQQS